MSKQPALLTWLTGLFLFLYLFLFSFHEVTFANQIEQIIVDDYFISLENYPWVVGGSVGSIDFDNGLIMSSNGNRQFPFISLSNLIPEVGDFFIRVTYQFPNITDFGVGVGMGNIVPVYGSSPYELAGVEFDKSFINYLVWSGKNDGRLLQARHCLSQFICDDFRTTLVSSPADSLIHILEIESIGANYYIRDDGILVQNQVLINSQRRPSVLWVGHPILLDSPQEWTTIKIINLKIGRIIDNLPRIPVVIIPGFGGSWDLGAIVKGVGGNNWKVPKQVKIYDGIMDTLVTKGFEKDKDLFIFPYDWRKPIADLGEDLNTFLIDKGLSNTKIDIVGHSMGGLVARAYAQKYGVSNINKIVTAGTPHQGVVDAYGLWEGGVFWGNIWWEKALVSLTTELNHRSGENKIDTLRRVAPAIKDILPTEDFISKNGVLQPWSNLVEKNSFLKVLNTNSLLVESVFNPLWSGDEQTRVVVNTEKRNKDDVTKNLWVDGKPVITLPFNSDLGDGTVTKKSAMGNFVDKSVEGTGNHIALISDYRNIWKILNVLGINTDDSLDSYAYTPSSVFMAVLASPGRLEVCNWTLDRCDNDLGLYFSDNKLFMLPGYNNEYLRVKVYAEGEIGKYGLHLGFVDILDKWEVVNGNLKTVNQSDTYYVRGGIRRPGSTDDCKNNGWQTFTLAGFINQGQCVSDVVPGVN